LSITFPRSVGQLPCYYDKKPSLMRSYVLADSRPIYPFGFGLSYTSFEYKNLQVQQAEISSDGTNQVSVEVTNTGKVKGDEIVQLYIHDVISFPTRPVKELKDFTRITLNPGETRKVTFLITPDKLEAYDENMKRRVQPGEFEVMIGKNSEDLLKEKFTVK
jgi:beta-glucosidase